MGQAAIGAILTLLLWVLPAAAAELTPPAGTADALTQRLALWPQWSLPAPLPRPGHGDLIYPAWFAGTWQVESRDLPTNDGGPAPPPQPPLTYTVHFSLDRRGRVVGDRAANAQAIGAAVLGAGRLTVRDDPHNPNRQLAQLGDGRQLDSRVVGRRSLQLQSDVFLADELCLQVLHGAGAPQISRIETLSRYQHQADGSISGEQWQMRYPSPAEGLAAQGSPIGHYQLRLVPGI